MPKPLAPASRDTSSDFKAYEDGKHRRYELLFAVNGGAFTVAKLFSEKDSLHFLGHLTLPQVAYGLAFFTFLMGVDIAVFGYNMRKKVGDQEKRLWDGVFSLWGRAVLFFICLLIIGGWYQVANGSYRLCT